MDRVHRITEGIIDDEEKGFKSVEEGEGEYVDKIFHIKKVGEKAHEKNENGLCRFYRY